MNYYIADLHLGHNNIIRLSNRPFKSVEEMDKAIIDAWNKTVEPDDDVYIIGDLIYRSPNPEQYLKALGGRKHLIKGNHDSFIKNRALHRYFESIDDIKIIQDGSSQVVLFHYPMAEWPGYYRDSILLWGHLHNNDNEAAKIMRQLKNNYNVGVDVIGFAPLTLKQIMERKKK